MKKILFPVFALMILAQVGLSAAESDSLKSLKPESKKTLKQMILMSGRLEESCDSKNPELCLGAKVNQSADFLAKSETESKAKSADAIPAIDERQVVIKNLSVTCKAGDAKSCKRLALISKEMNKPRTSIQLFKMACDNGDVAVCRELAQSLDKAGKKDLAALYLEKACQKGDTKSCAQPAKK